MGKHLDYFRNKEEGYFYVYECFTTYVKVTTYLTGKILSEYLRYSGCEIFQSSSPGV